MSEKREPTAAVALLLALSISTLVAACSTRPLPTATPQLTLAPTRVPAPAVQPLPTLTRAPAATPVPPPPTPVVHIVESGDTLWDLALLYDITVDDIVQANGLEDEHMLSLGQELRIPLEGWTPPKTGFSATYAPPRVEVAPWCSQFDPPGDDRLNPNGEYVCFENNGDVDYDLSGWYVRDEFGWAYEFPLGFVLAPGTHVQLHSGHGQDSQEHLYWSAEREVWDSPRYGGDTVYLHDGRRVLRDSYGY